MATFAAIGVDTDETPSKRKRNFYWKVEEVYPDGRRVPLAQFLYHSCAYLYMKAFVQNSQNYPTEGYRIEVKPI